MIQMREVEVQGAMRTQNREKKPRTYLGCNAVGGVCTCMYVCVCVCVDTGVLSFV